MRGGATEHLREQARGAMKAEVFIAEAAEMKAEEELLQAIELLFLHCAHLSDLILRSTGRKKREIDKALDGIDRAKLQAFASPIFGHVSRTPKSHGSVFRMPAAITPSTWVIALGSDEIVLTDVFDAVETLARHLGEFPHLPPNGED